MGKWPKLTGRISYRKTWTGKLILQVEVSDFFEGIGVLTAWRDARLIDVIYIRDGKALATNTEEAMYF